MHQNTFTYVYLCIYVYTSTHVYVYSLKYIYLPVHIYTHRAFKSYTSTFMYIRIYLYICICIRIHIYVYTCIYIYIRKERAYERSERTYNIQPRFIHVSVPFLWICFRETLQFCLCAYVSHILWVYIQNTLSVHTECVFCINVYIYMHIDQRAKTRLTHPSLISLSVHTEYSECTYRTYSLSVDTEDTLVWRTDLYILWVYIQNIFSECTYRILWVYIQNIFSEWTYRRHTRLTHRSLPFDLYAYIYIHLYIHVYRSRIQDVFDRTQFLTEHSVFLHTFALHTRLARVSFKAF